MGEDVPPAILAEQVVQPKHGKPEQGNAKEGGPRGDFASYDRGCQARYRSRAFPRPGARHPPHGVKFGRLLRFAFVFRNDQKG